MVSAGSSLVVVLAFMPLFSPAVLATATGATAAVGTSSPTCGLSFSTDVVSNVALREISKIASSLKIVFELQNGAVDIAQKYWNEVVCIESQRTDVDQAALNQRLFPSVQRIIRDFLVLSSDIGPNSRRRLNTNLLRFIDQFENVPKEAALEFLLNELGDVKTELFDLSYFLFDLGVMIKESQGSDSELLKKLPKVVQDIVSGQNLVLKNNETNHFIVLDTDTDATSPVVVNKVNAQSIDVGTDRNQAKWSFEAVKNLNPPPSWERWEQPNLYMFQLKSTKPCPTTTPGTDCSQLLKANVVDGPQQDSSNHYSHSYGTTTAAPSSIKTITGFTLTLESTNTISFWVGSQFLAEESGVVSVKMNERSHSHYYGDTSSQNLYRFWIVEV